MLRSEKFANACWRPKANRAMKWVYALVPVALAIGFLYFLSGEEVPTLQPFPAELSDDPDAFMEGFEITQFDVQGIMLYEIAAEQASYYERRGQTDIQGLQMKVYTPKQDVWQLAADEAVFEDRQEDPFLLLDGNVRLASLNGPQSTMTFLTESLKIYPRRRWVESLSTVTLEKTDSKIHAEKFEADLDTQNVRFTSGVESQVELLLRTDS